MTTQFLTDQPTPKPPTDAALRLIHDAYAVSNPESRQDILNRVCQLLRNRIERFLRLPRPAQSVREDCVQELTFGLFQLLTEWHRQGKLGEIHSFDGFARHYIKWHLPPTLRRLRFAYGSSRAAILFVYESNLEESAGLYNRAMQRSPSGCHQSTDALATGRDSEDEALRRLQAAELDAPGRRAMELADAGEKSRRRIELALIEEFDLSHRQARRLVDDLPRRIRQSF